MKDIKLADGFWIVRENGDRMTKVADEEDLRDLTALIPFASMCQYIDQIAAALRKLDEETKEKTLKKEIFRGEEHTSWVIPCYADKAKCAIMALVRAYESDIGNRVAKALK